MTWSPRTRPREIAKYLVQAGLPFLRARPSHYQQQSKVCKAAIAKNVPFALGQFRAVPAAKLEILRV